MPSPHLIARAGWAHEHPALGALAPTMDRRFYTFTQGRDDMDGPQFIKLCVDARFIGPACARTEPSRRSQGYGNHHILYYAEELR